MFDELRTFVLFGEEGSLQKVAQRLPLTQPAVSRQVQRLEQALGLRLLDRRQKPPALTPMGVEVLARGREILEAIEKLKAISALSEPEGVFRVGLVNGLAHDTLAKSFAAVIERFPRVSLRLKSGWSSELAEQHRMGLLDAAIILSDGSQFYDAETIGEEHLIAVAARDLSASPEQRQRLGWVLSPEPCDARRSLAKRLAQHNLPLIVVAEIEHAGLQMALVRQGLGLGLMPKRLLGRTPPDDIEEIDAVSGFHLDVLMLRSPHLGAMAKVADAIATETRAFVAQSNT